MDPGNDVLGYSDAEDDTTVQPRLEARGITAHRVAVGNHTEDGGSVRCATHPRVRCFGSKRG